MWSNHLVADSPEASASIGHQDQLDRVAGLRRKLQRMIAADGVHRLDRFSPRSDATPLSVEGSNAAYWQDSREYYTGYPSGVMFSWDQYFEAILQWHAGLPATWARNGLTLFLDSISPDGFIPRTVPKMWWSLFQAQPFFCQLALLITRWEEDDDWLYPAYYFRLKQYLYYWLNRLAPGDTGLAAWDHAGHTGMDNHYERAGNFHDAYCLGVDLNSYLIRELEALALLSRKGHARKRVPDESATFLALAARLKANLIRWCWDDGEAMLFDCDARDQRPIPVRHGGVFAALWTGALSAEQADGLVRKHLLNPEEFSRPWPIPALAKSEAGYNDGWLPGETLDCCTWRAHTWMPINYFTFQGLRRYGFAEEAAKLARRSEETFVSNPFREYYLSESGEGMGRQDFLGWSALSLYMRQEVATGCDPTAIDYTPL